MILADTSVWIDHFRSGEPRLVTLLEADQVLIHPFIVGELACGNLSDRGVTLELLKQLPPVLVADHTEVMTYIGAQRLQGRGIGYVDVHLLASAAIEGCVLWTQDKRLKAVAADLGLAAAFVVV